MVLKISTCQLCACDIIGKEFGGRIKVLIPFTRIFHLFKDLRADRWEMPKKIETQGKQKRTGWNGPSVKTFWESDRLE